MLRSSWKRIAVVSVAVVVTGLFATSARAQDTLVFVDVDDTTGVPAGIAYVEVFIQNVSDTIEAFELWFSLSRPDIGIFEADTTIDTCFVCIDSLCTLQDTIYPCTTASVAVIDTGSMVADWEYLEARTFGGNGTDLKVTGIANTASSGIIPILPAQQGLLFRLQMTMDPGIPDTLQDRMVRIDLVPSFSFFSNRSGDLLVPTKLTSGSVTATGGILITNGDVNCDGVINVLDVVYEIDHVFRFGPEPCADNGDVNCDPQGVVNVLDVVYLIDYVFRFGPPPCLI